MSIALLTLVLLPSIACKDTGVEPDNRSTIRVTVHTSGLDTDDSFLVSLDNDAQKTIASGVTLVLRSVTTGRHTVALSDVRENCAVSGQNPVVIDVAASATANVDFQLTCTAVSGVIAVSVSTSGTSDAGLFGLEVDGAQPVLIRGNQTMALGVFPRGVHTISLVDVPQSCTVNGPSSTKVSIVAGGTVQDTVAATFHVTCELGPVNSEPAIAFTRGDTVMLVNDDGSGLRSLVQGTGAAWSPSHTFVAFVRTECNEWDCDGFIWTVNPGGSGQRRVTSTSSFSDSDPAVSPDGLRIAFIRFWWGPDQTYLAVSDLNGSQPRVLAIWDPYSEPTWSPDGKRIAFTCEGAAPSFGGLDICLVDDNMTPCTSYFVNQCVGQRPPVVHLTNTRFEESAPAWSPDGSRIAFTLACSWDKQCPAGVTPDQPYIALLDVATKSVSLLAPGENPAWSPDGKRIVYESESKHPGLSLINADGSSPGRLVEGPATNPAWK
jgi:hypothetical protein